MAAPVPGPAPEITQIGSDIKALLIGLATTGVHSSVPQAQLSFQNLAAGILWQGIYEMNSFGSFKGRKPAPHMLDDLVFRQLAARFAHDDGGDRLDPPWIRSSDDGYLGDFRDLIQRFFYLATCHVFAAGFYHVLLPVDDGQVPVGINDAKIAAVEPAPSEGLARFFIIIEIPGCQLRRTMNDLADRTL